MFRKNQTDREFVLLGFPNLYNFRIPLFCFFLLIYLLIICENVLIVVLVSTSQNLQSPMYFFLRQLSLSDLLQTASIVPLMITAEIYDGIKISFPGCIAQFYFFGSSEAFQCIVLTVMSYDRYLAICNPLCYTSLMTHKVCVKLIVVSWVVSLSSAVVSVNFLGGLQFCNENIIDHFFCDVTPLLDLSCSDTSIAQIVFTILSIPVIILPFVIITVSYACILLAVLKIESNIGRQKAFSTCSSHLAAVTIFYGTLISIYVVPPKTQSLSINKVLSLFYTVVIPLVNPIIYSLRSKDIKLAFQNAVKKCTTGY